MEISMAAIVLLSAAVLYLGYRLLALKRTITQADRQLQEISRELEENRIVKLAAPEGELEAFLVTVNENLKEIRRERLEYQRRERQWKEQVENISHDLRTPLTAVLGYLKLVDNQQLSMEDREFLEIALKKSQSLQRLVNQFYELSRVSSEDFQLKREQTDTARLLRECCLEQYALFDQAGLELKLSIPEHPLWLFTDPEALERIFVNLLQNAARYGKSLLEVTVRAKGDAHAEYLFSNDLSEEMEEVDPDLLFQRFYMQERSRTRGGTGLGLTIAKHLAEQLGGSLQARYETEGQKRYLVFAVEMKK